MHPLVVRACAFQRQEASTAGLPHGPGHGRGSHGSRSVTGWAALVAVWLAWASPVLATGFEPLPGAAAFGLELQQELRRALAARGPDHVPRTRHTRADGSPVYTNRLLLEASPYLQQHAHNPVDWRPWGDAAFADAKRLGRPVLVSIGYSTCHWCHVMEEESFDDPATARLLNEAFVAIKVDREARPDIDAIYMSAIHATGERGGWPLNVFVTPDRKPFHAGTYFPPRASAGRPAFRTVLTTIRERWAQDRARLGAIADRLAAAVASDLAGHNAVASHVPNQEVLASAAATSAARIDREYGGIGSRTKFPSSTPLRFLLRHHRRTGDTTALQLATLTLERMAAGGIYDQLGGGFHRYSTEPRWLIPHFEKMLYDNALLVPAYLEAAQLTGRTDFERIAREVLDYVLREMTAPGGGFYSATDADSRRADGELEEGAFFTWTSAEMAAVLGPELARVAGAYWGLSDAGHIEGRNILHVARPAAHVAASLGMTEERLAAQIAGAREQLYRARLERPPPLRDEKILAAWNGLMISAFARAGLALAEARYTEAARRAAGFALEHLRVGPRLRRMFISARPDAASGAGTAKAGHAAGPAFLEDHAFLIAGLLDLYEADPDPHWLREAIALQRTLDAHHADREGGGYFVTADDGEALIVREKASIDGAEPSGNSVAALNLLRLGEYTGDAAYDERATLLFSAFHASLKQAPLAFSELLLAVDFLLDDPLEIVIVTPAHGNARELLDVLRRRFVPNRVLITAAEGADLEAHAELVPLAGNRRAIDGRSTAYVCVQRVCDYPTNDPVRFAQQLDAAKPPRKAKLP